MTHLLFVKSGSTWDPMQEVHEYPLRAFGVIEFYKLCAKKAEIIGIDLDIESKSISFMFQGEKKK